MSDLSSGYSRTIRSFLGNTSRDICLTKGKVLLKVIMVIASKKKGNEAASANKKLMTHINEAKEIPQSSANILCIVRN